MTSWILFKCDRCGVPESIKERHELFDAPPLFEVDDLKDAGSLANKLRAKKDPLSQYLHSQLSPKTQRLLEQYDATAQPNLELLIFLAADLNQLLKGPSLHDNNRFKQVVFSDETEGLLAKENTGGGLLRLNRLLLEDAYPHEIAKGLFGEKHLCLQCMRLALLSAGPSPCSVCKKPAFRSSPNSEPICPDCVEELKKPNCRRCGHKMDKVAINRSSGTVFHDAAIYDWCCYNCAQVAREQEFERQRRRRRIFYCAFCLFGILFLLIVSYIMWKVV
jgi:hypothetical protein